MKLLTGGKLPRFLSESISNIKANQNQRILQLKEQPFLNMPEKFQMELESNLELVEKFKNSFENFLRTNPIQETVVEEVIEKIEPLPKTDTEIQKEYNPIAPANFSKHKSLCQNLKCYINACNSSNMTERAFVALMSVRAYDPSTKHMLKLNDPELYSDLMAKYSMQRNWARVNYIYNILIAEKIPSTPQIYMIILDCLGRLKDSKENTSLIMKFITKAKDQVRIFFYFEQY